MCGRYVLLSDAEQLAEHFAVGEVVTEPLPVRYNVAPSTMVYAVREREGKRRLAAVRWGFVPHWARASSASTTRRSRTREPINARLETVDRTRMFADSFARRRCLIPADGFYEWQQRGEGRPKQPYYLAAADGAPLAFAGIWSVWRDPEADAEAEPLVSAAIITTDANGPMRDIHGRMPLILPEPLWGRWLHADPDDAPHLADDVRALDPPELVATPISTRVNNVRNDGPELLEPVAIDDPDATAPP